MSLTSRLVKEASKPLVKFINEASNAYKLNEVSSSPVSYTHLRAHET